MDCGVATECIENPWRGYLPATTGLNAALVPLGCGSVLSPLSPLMLVSSSFLEQGAASAITSQAHVCRGKRLAAKGANEAQPSAEDTHRPELPSQQPST